MHDDRSNPGIADTSYDERLDPQAGGDAELASEADADEEFDQAVMAADDTGMIAGERIITVAELHDGDSGAAGDV